MLGILHVLFFGSFGNAWGKWGEIHRGISFTERERVNWIVFYLLQCLPFFL